MAKAQTLEAIFRRVRKVKNGCWIWVGCINKHTGYAVAGYRGRVMNAHKLKNNHQNENN